MNPSDLSPKAEPVMWSTLVGLAVAALVSYNIGITDQLKDLLVYLPVVVTAIYARSQVTAPDTLKQETHQAYVEGIRDASTPEVV